MRTTLLLTVVGEDRTGLVESLAKRIADAGGNWEESRLARLAGQFSGIVVVTVEASRADALTAALRELEATGFWVTARVIPPQAPQAGAAPRQDSRGEAIAAHAAGGAGSRVRLAVTGSDRPGIVRDVCRRLAARGVNVEELESNVRSAPMSGEAMFVARARLLVPPHVALGDVQTDLEALANELMVDFSAE